MKSIVKTPRRLSVSTWSLHRALGNLPFYGVVDDIPDVTKDSKTLLQLPAQLKSFGINTLEICHFHLASRDDNYLEELRAALDENDIEIWSLLIDDGDICSIENGERDTNWIASWFPIAQKLGAKNVRVSGGKTRDDKAVSRSANAFRVLDAAAKNHNLRLMTENWQELLSSPREVLELFSELDGEVGLCFDFGNWSGKTKYDNLQQIAHLAESCHAKAHFLGAETINIEDYTRCLGILKNADFSGPFTLINGTPGDEWRGLELEKEIVQHYL